MNKFYGYARVSTLSQSDISIELQLEYLSLQAEKQGLPFEAVWEKQSGKSVEGRQEFSKLLEQAQRGDIIGFYDNSRLGRTTEENLRVVKALWERGVTTQVNGKLINPDDPQDKLFLTIESAVSDYQRTNQLLKSKAGIKAKKKKGEWIFTGRIMGWQVTRKGSVPTVSIVEHEAEIIRFIFNKYAQGWSIKRISEALNSKGYVSKDGKSFYAATVRRYILTPLYMGFYLVDGPGGQKANGSITVGLIGQDNNLVESKYYPPIVSPELWWNCYNNYKVMDRSHSRQLKYRFSEYELTSVIRCRQCGAAYIHSYHKSARRDGSIKLNSNYVIRGCTCKPANVEFFTLRAWVYEAIFRATYYMLFLNGSEISQFVEQKESEYQSNNSEALKDVQRIDGRISELDRQRKNLVEAISVGVISHNDAAEKMEQIKSQISQLDEEKRVIISSVNDGKQEVEQFLEMFSESRLEDFIGNDSTGRRKAYISTISQATINKDKLIIRYINGKTFVIQLIKNRARIINTVFEVAVLFQGRYQYHVRIDTERELVAYMGRLRQRQKQDIQQALDSSISHSIEQHMAKVHEYITVHGKAIGEESTLSPLDLS